MTCIHEILVMRRLNYSYPHQSQPHRRHLQRSLEILRQFTHGKGMMILSLRIRAADRTRYQIIISRLVPPSVGLLPLVSKLESDIPHNQQGAAVSGRRQCRKEATTVSTCAVKGCSWPDPRNMNHPC